MAVEAPPAAIQRGIAIALSETLSEGIESMDPMNLLVVERGADWTHWAATSHLVGHAMLVLAQHGDEPSADFRRRVRSRLSRIKKQPLNSVVLLRGETARSNGILQELTRCAPNDIRIYPSPS
jgi:hypothetical protein